MGIWDDMARRYEEDEEALIAAEREKLEDRLRETIDEYGDFDEQQLEAAKDAYVSRLGYERAMEILKGVL